MENMTGQISEMSRTLTMSVPWATHAATLAAEAKSRSTAASFTPLAISDDRNDLRELPTSIGALDTTVGRDFRNAWRERINSTL